MKDKETVKNIKNKKKADEGKEGEAECTAGASLGGC